MVLELYFLCIYEDEFEGNDEGLRGDGQIGQKAHKRKSTRVSQEQNSNIPEPTFQLSEQYMAECRALVVVV